MIRDLCLSLSVLATIVAGAAWAADTKLERVTILAREQVLEIDNASVADGELLVPVDKVEAITGFAVKKEGLCAGEVCIPADPAWQSQIDGKSYFNLSRFAKQVDQVFAVDAEQHVWSFTPVPQAPTSPLVAGMAPDFALPDLEGKMVRLSDFRGKKVLILTWASWCGCRLDLAGWQKVYEPLKDKNFEILCVAEDTEGVSVAEPWYTKGKVTYKALVDTKHVVSSLYHMVNVPTGVWVDESGKIVRPAEVAYSHKQQIFGQTIGDDRYAAGLADWVEKGPKSSFVVDAARLKEKLAVPPAKERLADAEFQMGAYFSLTGNRKQATAHWQEAQKLCPDNWNFHRQDWAFEKNKAMTNWMAKFRKLEGKPYYAPVEFPAASTDQ